LSATGNTPVSHAAPVTSEVQPGTYQLNESGPTTNYASQGWVCTPVVQSGASVTLAAGQSTTCTITNAYTPPPVTRIVTPDAPAISLVKVATVNETDDDLVAQDGESISYSFVVKNTGDVALSDVTVIDTIVAVGTVTCPATTLAVGATFTCTAASFPVNALNATGADIVNTAIATGVPPAGGQVSDTSSIRTPTSVGEVLGEVVTVAPGNVPAKVVKGAVVTKSTVAPAKVTALAFTGAETVPLGLFGLLALLLGAGLVATTRRQGRRANN
jgi:uncharacterized repeat protein (TIGR01451 family)